MPEVKYTGAPTQTPEEARRTAQIPAYRLDFPHVQLTRAGQVAGEAIGQATKELGATMHTLGGSIDSLGRTMQGAGDELFNRALGLKQLETETAVNNATISWEQNQIKKDEEFKKLNGEAASSQALEAHLKSSEDDRQKVKSALGSQQAQKMFDQQTTRPYLQFARSAAAHANQEFKKFATQTVEARTDVLGNRMASSKEDKDFYEGAKEGYKIFMDERRHLLGQDEVTAQRDYMTWYTKSIAAWAQKLSTDGDNARAMKILEDNKEDLDKVDRKIFTEVYKQIKDKNERDQAWTMADKAAHSGKPDDTYEVKEQRLIEELKRTGQEGNLNLTRDALTNLRTQHSIDTHKQNELKTQAWESISKALHNPPPGQKEAPKTEKELMAAIKESDWKILSEEQRQAARKIWEANALGNYPDNMETYGQFHTLAGGIIENPKDIMEKMAADPAYIDTLKIPKHYRDQLFSMYLAVSRQGEKAEEDQRVARVYSYGMNNFLITKDIDDKKELRQRFKSFLSKELEEWHREHPKQMPKGDDFKDMIIKARENVITKKRDWWFNQSMERYLAGTDISKTPEGKAFREKYIRDNPGRTPDEREILDAYTKHYVRTKMKEIDSGPAKPATAPVAPKKVQTIQVGPGGGTP